MNEETDENSAADDAAEAVIAEAEEIVAEAAEA